MSNAGNRPNRVNNRGGSGFTERGDGLLNQINAIETQINTLLERYRSNGNIEPNSNVINGLVTSVVNLTNDIKRAQTDFKARVTQLLLQVNSFNANQYIKKGPLGRKYVLSKIPPIMQMDGLLSRLETAAIRNQSARRNAANAANRQRRRTAATTTLQRLLRQVAGARRNVNNRPPNGNGNGNNGTNNAAQPLL